MGEFVGSADCNGDSVAAGFGEEVGAVVVNCMIILLNSLSLRLWVHLKKAGIAERKLLSMCTARMMLMDVAIILCAFVGKSKKKFKENCQKN